MMNDDKYTECFKCKSKNIEQYGDSDEDYYEFKDCGHFREPDERAWRRTDEAEARIKELEDNNGLLNAALDEAKRLFLDDRPRIAELERNLGGALCVIELHRKVEHFDRLQIDRLEDDCVKLKAQVPKWVSVNNPPTEDGRYLVNMPGIYGVEHAWFKDGKWSNRAVIFNSDVTHWMPLPSPPEKEVG